MKPILCLDFDGVLHSYTSGWKGADVISDPPVPGMEDFLGMALEFFDVSVFSSRSNQEGGIRAMCLWLAEHLYARYGQVQGDSILSNISFPMEKPPAMVTLDDRAITFTGEWPEMQTLLDFKPWNKK